MPTNGDDTLYGDLGPNVINGLGGDDLVFGGDDDDLLKGSAGRDTLYGLAGADTLNGGSGDDSLFGGADADVLYGSLGRDTLYGDDGDDTMAGGDGGDSLDGGAGIDKLDGGAGDDSLSGGDGDDSVAGGAGDDTLGGGSASDILGGGRGDDVLAGGDGVDTLTGGAGDDLLDGGADADVLDGGRGDDKILGGVSTDYLYGGKGDDLIDGGADDDYLADQRGSDTLIGGSGADVFSIDASDLTDGDVNQLSDLNFGDGDYLIFNNLPGSPYNSQPVFTAAQLHDLALSLPDVLTTTGNGFTLNVDGAVATYVFGTAATPTRAVIVGASSGDGSGTSVSSAGDVDGDGLSDVLVGAPYADLANDPFGRGLTYLVFGRALADGGVVDLATLGSDGVAIVGLADRFQFGTALSSAGDVDGDGLDDVIVAIPDAAPEGRGNAGASYIVFGSALADGGSRIDLGALGDDGIVIEGARTNGYSGSAVAAAGDVDGDGLGDVIVGAPLVLGGAPQSGVSYLVTGATLDASGGVVDLRTLTDSVAILGIERNDVSGSAVSSAGDVDGDGLDDVLIGAPRARQGAEAQAGEAYVVFGKALAAGSGTVDLAALGDDGVLIAGVAAYDRTGESLSSAGDVDGDGLGDIIVSAANASGGTGASYVVFGRALAASDGTLDLGTLASGGVVIKDPDTVEGVFAKVSAAGDVDRDGLDDVIVSMPFADPDGKSQSGQSYVVFGATLASSGGIIDLATIGTGGVLIKGADADDRSGFSVSSAGDVDGDGLADIVVGAPQAARGSQGFGAGETSVIFGAALAAEKLDDGIIDLGLFV